ncbi:MAG TPA: hypothetical protein VHP33_25620 [Polyangiaceae bacterium]|nr:hypothetical protein [Polyangiaceae bacterium]
MLRTSVGVCLLVVLGAAGACSSKSTKDDDDTTAGKGSILGGSNGGGTGGASSAGTRTDTGGTATSTGGTANGLCPGPILTCVDDTMATFCDPDTGVEETFSCVDDAKEIGFNSSGCTKGSGLTEDECALDSVADEACLAGAQAYAYCGGFTTNQQLFNIYVNCFQDYMDGHTIIPCFAEYVSETMTADEDCNNAVEACLGIEVGGAGSGGAGSDPTAGAGGAQ